MPRTTYSIYEAKARFSEIIKRVREGARVKISYRGEEVAEIVPASSEKSSLKDRLRRLEEQGQVQTASVSPRRPWPKPLASKPGATSRFLRERD